MTKTLINAGPTGRGWHYYESVLRCPQLFAYRHRSRATLPDRASAALIKGSLLHVGVAHHYARTMPGGTDTYYEPAEAIELAAKEFGDAAYEHVPLICDVIKSYVAFWGVDSFKVIGVEQPFSAEIKATPESKPRPFTQRMDLIVEDLGGRVWIYDTKTTSAFIGAREVYSYSISGQFLAMNWFGRALYGDRFGGVQINAVNLKQPYAFDRKNLEPMPWMLSKFPGIIEHAASLIESLTEKFPDPFHWPAVASDLVCVHRYGKCSYYEVCQFGG